jgi:DNA topoisomerase-1
VLTLLQERLSREVEKQAEKKPAKKRRASPGNQEGKQPEMQA